VRGAGDLLGGREQVHDPHDDHWGKTWQVQLGGDPEASDDPLTKVFFLDSKNGWAVTDRGKILGTRDGGTWAELSTVGGTTRGVWFPSPQTGLEINGWGPPRTLQRSDDGGKTWKPLSPCSVDAMVGGLPRKLGCVMGTPSFCRRPLGSPAGRGSRHGNACRGLRQDQRRRPDVDDVGDSGNQA
jgi:photosystem II stability/assembly factor-like uncharacterized protein